MSKNKNKNKNSGATPLIGYAGTFQRLLANLSEKDKIHALADLARAHSFHYFTVDEVDYLIEDEDGLTAEGIFFGMIEIFMTWNFETRTVERTSLMDDGVLRETTVSRVISEQEMVDMALELQNPTVDSSEEIRVFAKTLRFYQSLFGEISWSEVPEYLRASTGPMLEDHRSDMILRVR